MSLLEYKLCNHVLTAFQFVVQIGQDGNYKLYYGNKQSSKCHWTHVIPKKQQWKLQKLQATTKN